MVLSVACLWLGTLVPRAAWTRLLPAIEPTATVPIPRIIGLEQNLGMQTVEKHRRIHRM